jgi:hypothetical protein
MPWNAHSTCAGYGRRGPFSKASVVRAGYFRSRFIVGVLRQVLLLGSLVLAAEQVCILVRFVVVFRRLGNMALVTRSIGARANTSPQGQNRNDANQKKPCCSHGFTQCSAINVSSNDTKSLDAEQTCWQSIVIPLGYLQLIGWLTFFDCLTSMDDLTCATM